MSLRVTILEKENGLLKEENRVMKDQLADKEDEIDKLY